MNFAKSNTRLQSFLVCALAVVIVIVSFSVTTWRDSGYGGPHHDEVISLLAAKALEREYEQLLESRRAPFDVITTGSDWHRFTKDFQPVAFGEIRQDVLAWDKHPPLSFWSMNRWLSLFREGTYTDAVILTWLQVLLAASILAFTVYRLSHSVNAASLASALFLAGNAAVVTGSWVRQYALFAVLFAGVVAVSVELMRRSAPRGRTAALAALMGFICLLGMMTQYTFITMTMPLHLALCVQLTMRKDWSGVSLLIGAYVAAASVFFLLMPGVLDQVAAVSDGLERQSQWGAAIGGVPAMFVPLPSGLPPILIYPLAVCAFLLPFLIAASLLWYPSEESLKCDRAMFAVPLLGMLGAGLLQFVMVGLGYFPGWATMPNHLAAFWLLTVLAASLAWSQARFRLRGVVTAAVFAVLLGMQGLYIWHLHRILPNVNKSYIASLQPDLVLLDNTARGFVLEITDVMPAEMPVLVTDSRQAAERFASGSLADYSRILYLPMDQTVKQGKPLVTEAANAAGWQVEELPVVHAGMFEAVLIQLAR